MNSQIVTGLCNICAWFSWRNKGTRRYRLFQGDRRKATASG